MTDDFIKRSEAIEFVKNNTPSFGNTTTMQCVERSLENVPAADVVGVVHGEWIRPTIISGRTFDIPHCSVCGDVPCDIKNYCPDCGAKMSRNNV